MNDQRILLYRGTTPDWPGSKGLQAIRVTPTTSDPLVATLFGLECLRFGPAIVQMCNQAAVSSLLEPANVLADLEKEVAVGLPPDEFTRRFAESFLPVLVARDILAELGFELPPTVANKVALQGLLKSTPRLRSEDIAVFEARAREWRLP